MSSFKKFWLETKKRGGGGENREENDREGVLKGGEIKGKRSSSV